jgi:hypothetical protein
VKNSCINVVAIANEAHSFTETHLLSLFYQNNITIGNLIILCKKSEITQIKTTINTLRRKWRMQTPITVTTDIGALARHLEANFCEHTLFVNTYIVLQNRNILQHLRLIAKQKNIFSAGCMLNHIHTSNEKEIYANSSAGLYPRLDEYTRSGFLHLEATNILSGLIPTQISVIANTPDLSLINTTKLLKDLPDLDSSKDITRVLLHASCLASLHNMYNIVSTKVAAQYSMSPTPNMSYYIGKKTTDALVSQWHKISGKISMCEDVMA